jgi:hypothetical protein
VTLAGFVGLARRRPALAAVVALWIGALLAMLSVQENWEELKMTYLVLLFPAGALPFAEGLRQLASPVDDRKRRLARVGAFLGCAAVVWLGARALGTVEAPVDERWWQRFPHAARNRAGFAELPHALRWSWEFFHSGESEAELRRERARLVPPRLLPSSYRERPLDLAGEVRRMRVELETPEMRTLAIWKYIYAPP